MKNKSMFPVVVCLTGLALMAGACKSLQTAPFGGPSRIFQTSFESVADFNGFWIEPQNHMGSASHDLSTEHVHGGTYSHKGWIYAANAPSTPSQNNNHRAYPTVQLHKTSDGAYRTPVLAEFWVWLDMTLAPGEWFSFATFARSSSDSYWDAVLVNLSDTGFVQLMHVPTQGQGTRTFQTTSVSFPMQTWVKLTVCLDFHSTNGYAKVWQDDVLVSAADVNGGNGTLPQAHFGLYAPPSLSSGVVYNDDLTIWERTTKE
jgi:hypothetical protein